MKEIPLEAMPHPVRLFPHDTWVSEDPHEHNWRYIVIQSDAELREWVARAQPQHMEWSEERSQLRWQFHFGDQGQVAFTGADALGRTLPDNGPLQSLMSRIRHRFISELARDTRTMLQAMQRTRFVLPDPVDHWNTDPAVRGTIGKRTLEARNL